MNLYKNGVEFEKEVAELFAELGYNNVIHNNIINGNQIDITAEHYGPDGSIIKYIIECKNYTSNVGLEEVNKYNIIFKNLIDSRKADKGIIVSKSGFTSFATQAAALYGIDLLEYDILKEKVKKEGPSLVDIKPVKEERLNENYVFVLMPFSENFEDLYYFGIREAVEEAGLYCERVDEIEYTGGVMEKVREQIKNAFIVIAEMTGRNPNVFYEVGFAHAWKKNTILIVNDSNEIPFDLRDQNHIVYNGSIINLKLKLINRLKAMK